MTNPGKRRWNAHPRWTLVVLAVYSVQIVVLFLPGRDSRRHGMIKSINLRFLVGCFM
jgi:hypothetical protein